MKRNLEVTNGFLIFTFKALDNERTYKTKVKKTYTKSSFIINFHWYNFLFFLWKTTIMFTIIRNIFLVFYVFSMSRGMELTVSKQTLNELLYPSTPTNPLVVSD